MNKAKQLMSIRRRGVYKNGDKVGEQGFTISIQPSPGKVTSVQFPEMVTPPVTNEEIIAKFEAGTPAFCVIEGLDIEKMWTNREKGCNEFTFVADTFHVLGEGGGK